MTSARRGRRWTAAAFLLLAACSRDTTAPAPPPIASLSVSPTGFVLEVGKTTQLVAIARDARGEVLADRPVSWRTDSPSVALVDEHGLVTAAGPGYVTIIAEAEGKSFGVGITVVHEQGLVDSRITAQTYQYATPNRLPTCRGFSISSRTATA